MLTRVILQTIYTKKYFINSEDILDIIHEMVHQDVFPTTVVSDGPSNHRRALIDMIPNKINDKSIDWLTQSTHLISLKVRSCTSKDIDSHCDRDSKTDIYSVYVLLFGRKLSSNTLFRYL